MVQHLLIGDIAALLMVLGLTGAVLAAGAGAPVVRQAAGPRQPLVALPLWSVNLYLWHIPALYEATVTNECRPRAPARVLHRFAAV